MARTVIVNLGTIVSGDLREPIVAGDTIVIEGTRIERVTSRREADVEGADVVIDAAGMTATPGFIDSHTHPAVGDWTPRLDIQRWIESYLHGGITTAISQGAIHLQGRPTDAAGTKALAILSAKTFQNFRPGGLKYHGGALILELGLTERDFKEMAQEGVELVAEIGAAGLADSEQAAPMTAWAKQSGMKVVGHYGPPSIHGSSPMGAEQMIALDVDVVGHVNGGSTSGAWRDVERLIDDTAMTLELAFTGNPRAMLDIVARLIERDELGRLIIGSDTPVGSGVMPLAVVRTVLWLCALGPLAPEVAIALATGNTARAYGFDTGRIAPGLAADLLVMDAPRGSVAADALGAFRRGDNPGIALVMVDGQVITTRPRNTLPPARAVHIKERTR